MLTFEELLLEQGDFRLSAGLTLQAGRITALMGPSGAGKSTLLSALAGFLKPQAGRIKLGGHDLTDAKPQDRGVAMLFQDNNLFPHLTAMQNVGLGLRPDLRLSADDRDKIANALASVGLAELGERKPAALSGGQQSRVALARVLVSDKPIVLLDEPFAALGPALRDEMLDLVATQLTSPQRVIVMVTHDPSDASRIADDIVLIADGVAAAPESTARLLADPPPALAAYLGDGATKKARR